MGAGLQVHPAKGTYNPQGQENTSSAHYMFQKYQRVITVSQSHSTGSSHQSPDMSARLCQNYLIETETAIMSWFLVTVNAPTNYPESYISFTSHNHIRLPLLHLVSRWVLKNLTQKESVALTKGNATRLLNNLTQKESVAMTFNN